MYRSVIRNARYPEVILHATEHTLVMCMERGGEKVFSHERMYIEHSVTMGIE